MKINFKQLSISEMVDLVQGLGEPSYRAEQIMTWIYEKDARTIAGMTNLPTRFRQVLSSMGFISRLNLLRKESSVDGTQKFLYRLEDGETIESVLIPSSRGSGINTLCISSQAGCAMGCAFCQTGRIGLKRNLEAHEIADQVILARQYLGALSRKSHHLLGNIVFMGMGEPLHNLDHVLEALKRITGQMGMSPRRITLSTAGLVPEIARLASSGLNVNLAVSLNASTDRVRNRLMPVNRRYPLAELLAACRSFPLRGRRHITFEYLLLRKINDRLDDAIILAKMLRGMKAKVNLIPYNDIGQRRITDRSDHPGGRQVSFHRPAEKDILSFQETLRKSGITVVIRKSMGGDIVAACGQLRAAYLEGPSAKSHGAAC